jgi:hypothetical protein
MVTAWQANLIKPFRVAHYKPESMAALRYNSAWIAAFTLYTF